MNEPDVLVPNDLHLINQPKSAQVVPKLLLRHILIQTSQINVAARVALLDRQGDLARHRRWLTPADLQILTVQRQLFDERIRMERSRRSTVKER